MRPTKTTQPLKQKRKGTVIAIAVFCLAVMMGFSALVVDLGYIHSSCDEMQRSADAAALAACWDLGEEFATGTAVENVLTSVTAEASTVANKNDVTNVGPMLTPSDVTFGYLSHNQLTNPNAIWDTSNPSIFNAVRVQI